MKYTYLIFEVAEEDLDRELDNKGEYGWDLVTVILKQHMLPSLNTQGQPRTETRFKLIFKKPHPQGV